ncbi:TetR/AcrR family transcriptional regulator [Pseudonocardia spinosispora]|uniref:TetR/AcrR family transcriptional regulator n=1 Tax=Pseudonocardia spinosispora TaxID=103441 RepID=UPI0003FE7A14|nr:TetR/AcrR family transcriptional regulator [Pseudonocardia spinosispora]
MDIPAPADPPERTRAARRAPGEVRDLLLDSARELFSAHGYANTSTKRIAEQAGVAEALLFRHFGSKAQLFREAVVEPLIEVLQGYAEEWLNVGPHEVEQPTHAFVKTFFDTLSDRRGFALALTAADNYTDDVVEDAGATLADVLRAIEGVVKQEEELNGYRGLNIPATTRVGVGSVLATAMFRSWIFGSDATDIADDRITNDLEQLLIHGVRHRAAPDRTA